MSDSPYIPFYTSDFLGGTSGMTAATKGVYITLLCLMYEVEGPLGQSWDTLARRSGCTLPAFKKAVQALVDDDKIEVSDAGIWSEKCAKHITKRCERSNSAKAAAKTRWEKTEQKQGVPDANAKQPQCQPEPEPESYKKKEPNGSLQKKGSRLPSDWVLPKTLGEWAVENGLTRDEVRREADTFKDYWIGVPGQKGVKLDWAATWRNWIRKRIKDDPRRSAGNQSFWFDGEVHR